MIQEISKTSCALLRGQPYERLSINIKEVTVMSECILTAAIVAIIYFACGYLRKLQGPTNQ
jgi:hypothetical protein